MCRKQHVKEICEEPSCDGKNCIKRHPKECKFFRNRGFCKFGEWCHFVHIARKDPEIEKIKAENKRIRERLDALEKLLVEKDKEMNKILKSIQETRNSKEKLLKCKKCNFETKSHSGLKIHEKKKHTSVVAEFPRMCDFCDKELGNASEMKKTFKKSFIQGSSL